MNPDQEIENIGETADDAGAGENVSVDDFIKQLEEKEKDLHISVNTTIIEIEESFDDANLPDFIKQDLQLELPAVAAAASSAKKGKVIDSATENELAGLKEKITQMKAERDELFQTSQRRSKDFENFKSRTERERTETFQNQLGNLATQMLPALDNLNRAVDFALAMPETERTGIQQIATVGELFDPHFHEAVATEDSSEFDQNRISAELLRGYRIGDRVIRHSMVKVARAPRFAGTEFDDGIAEAVDEVTVDQDSHTENSY